MSTGKERSAAGLYYTTTTTYLQIITMPEYRGLEIKLTRKSADGRDEMLLTDPTLLAPGPTVPQWPTLALTATALHKAL